MLLPSWAVVLSSMEGSVRAWRCRRHRAQPPEALPGAGAGAGAAEQFYSEPEPEPECFPGAGAGAAADQKCHGSASLLGPRVWC